MTIYSQVLQDPPNTIIGVNILFSLQNSLTLFLFILSLSKQVKRINMGSEGETVCVTGAAGFIGSWLVMRLLERGYTVRATVRDPGLVLYFFSQLLPQLFRFGIVCE